MTDVSLCVNIILYLCGLVAVLLHFLQYSFIDVLVNDSLRRICGEAVLLRNGVSLCFIIEFLVVYSFMVLGNMSYGNRITCCVDCDRFYIMAGCS